MNNDIKSLFDFLKKGVCNFYAVDAAKDILNAAGYTEKCLCKAFSAQPGDKFYVTKNDSAIFAVKVGKKPVAETGFRIIAAHSDSPCFRLKPNCEIACEGGIVKLNTEVYGGPILYTWFDRPLSLAGRVVLRGDDDLHPRSELVRFNKPLLSIPHLAIHFNRAVNEGNPLSKQKDMLPIIAKAEKGTEKGLIKSLVAQELNVNADDILDFDLMIYDVQEPMLYGVNEEFISSGRLDDLSMAHCALQAITNAENDDVTCVAAIFDNEETGSGTKQGAHSPVLANLLHRLTLALGGDYEQFCQAVAKSFMVSADNAHAFHPNYPEKFDPTNHPAMGGGPVIKVNANCKYMSDAHSAAVFMALGKSAGVNVQYFVNHSDVAGGSTLGNIFTGQLDIEGVDVGNPMLAMHSCRESASVTDHIGMIQIMKQFFK